MPTFPAHWGKPPARQTKDLRPLPGGYGTGSSTLVSWIQEHLDKDAASPPTPPRKGCRWANKKVDTGLAEFSVIYTDRAVNMLSQPFIEAMQHISATMKKVYKASAVALVPGSGSYAMEAVARQFGTGKKMLVLRNGYFSFRWSDIITVTGIAESEDHVEVIKAAVAPGQAGEAFPQFAPLPLAVVVAKIMAFKPAVVFAPHVETSTGMILPDDYMAGVAAAVHAVGGIFVLDSIASGTAWVDMASTGVDVLISAPQKGWSGPACCGLVMMSSAAQAIVLGDQQPKTNSFCCNLRRWTEVMASYEAGKAKYYTTLPTDALMMWYDVLKETEEFGFEQCRTKIFELGGKIRAVLEAEGFKSVAAPGFKAPGVVVSYSNIPGMYDRFKAQNLQIAGGVPFKLGEKIDARSCTFRIGLFGLDKNKDVDGTVRRFKACVKCIVGAPKCPK